MESEVVSRVKEELAAEWKKKPVARVFMMLPEASFMYIVTDMC